MMLSDGTNAVTSFLYQSASILTVGDGVTDRSLYWRGGKLQGYSNSGGTLDVQFDPQGVSFLDSATVGGSHSSGTDETLCIGWICDTLPLKGTLDIRTNSNTIDAATANSGGLHVLNTDTVNTGSAAVESWSVSIEGGQVRGTGTGSLTSYGLVIDHPSNAQVDYAVRARAVQAVTAHRDRSDDLRYVDLARVAHVGREYQQLRSDRDDERRLSHPAQRERDLATCGHHRIPAARVGCRQDLDRGQRRQWADRACLQQRVIIGREQDYQRG